MVKFWDRFDENTAEETSSSYGGLAKGHGGTAGFVESHHSPVGQHMKNVKLFEPETHVVPGYRQCGSPLVITYHNRLQGMLGIVGIHLLR